MEAGTVVYWNAVNGVTRGTIQSQQKDGDYLVALDNGKYVIVNEKSFCNEQGTKLAK